MEQQGKFSLVQQYIQHVFLKKSAVTMSTLHSIYGLHTGDSRYRSKLKQKIVKEYKHKVTFLSVGPKVPDIIVDSSIPASEVSLKDETGCIINAAELLRKDILSYSESLQETSWPPPVNELIANDESFPPNLLLFLKHFLHSQINKRKPSELTECLINSIASDLISGVTHSKTITTKQFLLALGLHNITGSRKVVDIVNRLGHCISYKYKATCDTETAQAVKSQALAKKSSILDLVPRDETSHVLTVF